MNRSWSASWELKEGRPAGFFDRLHSRAAGGLILLTFVGCFCAGGVQAQEAPLPLPAEVAEPAPVASAPAEAALPEKAVTASGEEAGAATMETEDAGKLNYSILQLIQFAGYIGYLIIILSFVALSLVVEYLLSLRRKVLVPSGDVELIQQLVRAGAFEELAARADEKASFILQVVGRGAAEADRGYESVVKAMEDKADELTGRLLRKIEHLNIIANIAPMLGLLGTVLGMVEAFNQISVSVGGVDPRRLAAGIFQALMTTVMGLIVAIPALYIFGLFRNRVDALVADAAAVAAQLVEPLKPRGMPGRKVAQAVGGRTGS